MHLIVCEASTVVETAPAVEFPERNIGAIQRLSSFVIL
jgi:hypothetical protein